MHIATDPVSGAIRWRSPLPSTRGGHAHDDGRVPGRDDARRPASHGVDWEIPRRLRAAPHLPAARASGRRWRPSDLGALLLFETSNIRYVTSTQIGYWAFNKGERYALLTRTGRPRICDFGSAAKAHRLQLPHLYDETNSVGGNTGLQGAIHPRVGLQKRAARGDPVDPDGGGRRRHAARRRRRRDVGLPRARRTPGIDVRDGQQVMMPTRARSRARTRSCC